MQKRCTIKQISLTTVLYNRKSLNILTTHSMWCNCRLMKAFVIRKAKWVALRALSKNINGKSYLHILHSNNYTIMIEFV